MLGPPDGFPAIIRDPVGSQIHRQGSLSYDNLATALPFWHSLSEDGRTAYGREKPFDERGELPFVRVLSIATACVTGAKSGSLAKVEVDD